jgi:hypothetical protein
MKYLFILIHTTNYHQPSTPPTTLTNPMPNPMSNPIYDNAPMPPLGTDMSGSGDEEQRYWDRKNEEMMGDRAVRRGYKWFCHGKQIVPSCKGDKEAYIFQVGQHYIAIDTMMGNLLNVGSDGSIGSNGSIGSVGSVALTWHYSTVSIDGDINTHVRAMMDHCDQMLQPRLYDITCTTLNK